MEEKQIMDEKQSKEIFRNISENIFQVSPLLKKRLSRMSTFQSKYGLPMSHFQVLALLEERESMSISEISDFFDIAKPNITPLVDRLVNAGLVDRVRSTTDRRVVNVVIQKEGRKRLREIRSSLIGGIENWSSILSMDDFRELNASLESVVRLLDKLS